jgi:arylsulfatase A-like enzyme
MRIIYFDIDSLRPDHLGCYGYSRPTSPNIDSVARRGIRFDRYYCSNSPCVPSRAAWLSGRYGIRNGVISNFGRGGRFRLDINAYGGPKPENELLVRQLRRHGYYTIGFSNFADRHNALWFMNGWTEFHTPNLKSGDETADEVNAPALRWLNQNATREDYFLYINYWDVHRNYTVDKSWARRFTGSAVDQEWPDADAVAMHQSLRGRFTAHEQFFDGKSPTPLMPDTISSRADFEHLVTGYDAAIAYVDDRIGQVLEVLDRQGVLDEAAVIISADHGDSLGEHGIYGDHVNADECIHRVPMVIKWPGVATAGSDSDAMRLNIDFAPTLCDLLGVPTPEDWDGISFRENLTGSDRDGMEYVVWDCGLYAVQRAIRTRRHLLITTFDNYEYSFTPAELYDMERDPYQTNDLSEIEPDVVATCRNLLEEWTAARIGSSGTASDPIQAVLEERTAGLT